MGLLNTLGVFDPPSGDAPLPSRGWRERAAPSGLQQLAAKLGLTPQALLERPDLIAAAVGQMEHAASPRHVAESFMDMVDRNGGGIQGVLKTLPHYDTLLMRNAREIGNLPGGEPNANIAGLDPRKLSATVQHLSDVMSGKASRVLPEGYTHNFSPSAGRVVQVNPAKWGAYRTPDGESVYAPHWAGDALRTGQFRNVGGEYFVPDERDLGKPFKASWSTSAGPGGTRAPTPADLGATPDTPPIPVSEGSSLYAGGLPLPPPSTSPPSPQPGLFGALAPKLFDTSDEGAADRQRRTAAVMRHAAADVSMPALDTAAAGPGSSPGGKLDLTLLRALLRQRRTPLGTTT